MADENIVLKISKEELTSRITKYVQSKRGSSPADTLQNALGSFGQNGLEGRKFVGYDEDWSHAMLYRIDKYSHNDGHPMLIISDLTLNPTARHPALQENKHLDLGLHLFDIDVTDWNLKGVAEAMGVSADNFHWYV
jgi:hypothetical protein